MYIYVYIIQSQCSIGFKLMLFYSNAHAAQLYTRCSTKTLHVHLDCTTLNEQIYTMNAARCNTTFDHSQPENYPDTAMGEHLFSAGIVQY